MKTGLFSRAGGLTSRALHQWNGARVCDPQQPRLPRDAQESTGWASRKSVGAFTLIEIMVVVAIMGIILAAGIPSLYTVLHKEGFRKAVSDVLEVCDAARSRAILKGTVTDIDFHPMEGWCEVSSGGPARRANFADHATVEMLEINMQDCRTDDSVRVRFYPNGTSDEMTFVLRSDKNEWRRIDLEITTGLTSLQTDPSQWR